MTPLQRDVLVALAGIEPRWTLTGGGALAGFHLGHRATRDLDLFWHGRSQLDELGQQVEATLRRSGMAVEPLHRAEAFCRLGARIQVDTPHEILVNKLCTLLTRAEVRDLVDVRALLGAGGDLTRALREAPRKDGGFSPLMVAWLLQGLPLPAMTKGAGLDTAELTELVRFRDELLARIVAQAAPSP